MGVDLTLLPIEHIDADWGFSHSVLSLHRRSSLWDALQEEQTAHGNDVPKKFNTYVCREKGKPTHYGPTQEDAYGDPLQWVRAKHLTRHADHEGVQESRVNRAVWAYLNKLPQDTKIALYWH